MQSVPRHYTAFAFAIMLLANAPAQASSSIQLKFKSTDGPAISGLSTVKGHEKSIDASSFQWGVGVGIGSLGSGRREASNPSVSDITWTQTFDSSYNRLNAALMQGGLYDSTFSFVTLGGKQAPDTYLSMATGTAAISGLSFSSGGDRPSVSASQAFRTFNMTYYDATRMGPGGSPLKMEIGYSGIDNKVTGETSRTAALPAGGGGTASGLYLRLGDGASAIFGDSTDRHYENWIQLSSAQMGIGIGLSPRGDSFDFSRPSVSELTVTQAFDGAVPVILSNLLRGREIGDATLEYVQSSGRGPVTLMQLKLDEVMFSGLSISSGGDRPSVSESLNFTGYTQTVWDLKADGTRSEPDVFSFDIATNKVRENGAPGASASLSDFGAGMVAPLPAAAPIPEPHSWALMAGGIAMLAMLRRRRRD